MESNKKKKLFRWIKVIVLLYSAIGIALFYLQEKFLFHPTTVERNVPWKFDMPFEEVDLAFNSTDTVNRVYRRARCDRKEWAVRECSPCCIPNRAETYSRRELRKKSRAFPTRSPRTTSNVAASMHLSLLECVLNCPYLKRGARTRQVTFCKLIEKTRA